VASPFTWNDGERVVRFGRGTLATATELLGDDYVLLTTARARDSAPDVVARAATVLDVAAGRVDDLAAQLLDEVPAGAPLVVALGGGRVIDTAKALAACRRTRAAAIPTTLSSAEMTWVHRLPADAPPGTRRARPAIVINDPALSASQPVAELAASAANSLGHAIEGPATVRSSPLPSLAGAEAIRLTAAALASGDLGGEAARDDLALAALLSGYAIDAAWYGLHHVLSQTLVRLVDTSHGQANAALLPHTAQALLDRGRPVPAQAIALAHELAGLAGASRLRDIGVERDQLAGCADAAADRRELDLTPPRADRDELLRLYEAAW
jgi:alcohol dehydrogenase class IV